MPGAGFKRLPPGTREDLHAFLHTPFEMVKKQMVSMVVLLRRVYTCSKDSSGKCYCCPLLCCNYA